MDKYEIYTDGSCWPNPNGIGGWAYVIVLNDQLIAENCGRIDNTTNNRMESTACIKALEHCIQLAIHQPVIYSDSQLVVRYSSKGRGRKNRDLLDQLVALNKTVQAKYVWIPGHQDIKWNEYVDQKASYKTDKPVNTD